MTLLYIGTAVVDFDLDLLSDVLAPLDKHLEGILQASDKVFDADQLGYYDRAEHVAGLGFVACQTYLG
jgi:hypothetical protein